MPDHVTYLESKRALDDRALARGVLSRLESELPEQPTVLEVGAGTLTMVERLFEWGVVDATEWVAVDHDEAALEAGVRRLDARADTTSTAAGIRRGATHIEVVVDDAFTFAEATDRSFDLLVGCAFFDLVDLERAAASFDSVSPLVYAPITYDGRTVFEPSDREDDAVLDRYRAHMESYRDGSPDGAAELASVLESVLADEPSPWVVEPPYHPGTQVVVEHVIDTIETAVEETGYDASEWANRRRTQLDAGELRYEASNRDLLGRWR